MMQSVRTDAESLAEHDLARRAAAALRAPRADRDGDLQPLYAALASFDGRFIPESAGATAVERLRLQAAADLVRARVPGQGGHYAPAIQTESAGRNFRAVWDVGNWDAGGIVIPLGESGEPGSAHYRDLAARYARHALTPLPFSAVAVAVAVARAAAATLTLER